MPLKGGTHTYEASKPPNRIGVYELFYGGNIVRIGSGRIKSRLQDHASGDPKFRKYRCKVTKSKRRALQIERKELQKFKRRKGRLPKYNKEIPHPP